MQASFLGEACLLHNSLSPQAGPASIPVALRTSIGEIFFLGRAARQHESGKGCILVRKLTQYETDLARIDIFFFERTECLVVKCSVGEWPMHIRLPLPGGIGRPFRRTLADH
jgi:hypothetical protein